MSVAPFMPRPGVVGLLPRARGNPPTGAAVDADRLASEYPVQLQATNVDRIPNRHVGETVGSGILVGEEPTRGQARPDQEPLRLPVLEFERDQVSGNSGHGSPESFPNDWLPDARPRSHLDRDRRCGEGAGAGAGTCIARVAELIMTASASAMSVLQVRVRPWQVWATNPSATSSVHVSLSHHH